MSKKCNPISALRAAVTDKPCSCGVCKNSGDERDISIAFCNAWQALQMMEAADEYAQTHPKFKEIWDRARYRKMEKKTDGQQAHH